MIPLITIVLISLILIILMIILRSYRVRFWMSFVNSKFIQKSDLLLEYLFSSFKKNIKILQGILLLEGEEFLFKCKNFLHLNLNKFFKEIKKQISKLYKRKITAPTSSYLKDIEKHKGDNM